MALTGIMALPAELLRSIYEKGLEHDNITLKYRVRALGVCRAWRQALSTSVLPIPNLEINGVDEAAALCKWVITAQPAVKAVVIGRMSTAALELLPQALHCLPRKELQEICWPDADTTVTALPCLGIWQRLQCLILGSTPYDAAWLQQLSSLRQLEHLTLHMKAPEQGGQTLLFPAMASLTRLSVGVPEGVHLCSICSCSSCSCCRSWKHMGLAVLRWQLQLQLLQKLETHGAGSVALEAGRGSGAPASQLRSASLFAARVAVDFRQLPALDLVELAPRRLEGAASIADATALTCLQLGTFYHIVLVGDEWVSEVLRHASSMALRALGIYGSWSAEAAVLVGDMAHLPALFVESSDPGFPLPPSGAPVWGQLRTFGWEASFAFPIPEALAAATRLEALQAYINQSCVLELKLLAELPALCKLILMCVDEDWHVAGRVAGDVLQAEQGVQEAAQWLAGRAMPNLEVLASWRAAHRESDTFFEWALGV